MPYIDTKYIGKCETCRSFREGVGCSTYCDHGECYSPSLRRFPTADVVEVVRCKDCTEWDNDECECSHWYGFKENDFCSYGERKEGDK